MWTKKDFIKLARTLELNRLNMNCCTASEQWETTVKAIAELCRQENPGFDVAKFLKATGYYNQ